MDASRLCPTDDIGGRVNTIASRRLRHRVKRREICFKIHLMWMPLKSDVEPPRMDWVRC